MHRNKSIIVVYSDGDWIKYACEQNMADKMIIKDKDGKNSISGRWDSLVSVFRFMRFLMNNRREINMYQSLIVVGTDISAAALLFRKLGIIKTQKVVWWGFFLHSHLAIKLYKFLRFMFESPSTVYILFSEFEKKLYASVFGKKTTSYVLPYGKWSSEIPEACEEGDYYFSGGYSNREYLPLIDAFRGTKYKLVIIASRHNKDLIGVDLPSNVTLLKDVDKATFHRYMGGSKGVIIALKHNLGASGQMVMINAMSRRKVIIINDNDIMKEYIIDYESGLIVKDIRLEIIGKIRELESDNTLKKKLEEQAYHKYMDEFSRKPSMDNTISILKMIQQ